MLEILFFYDGRIKRWDYFKGCIGLWIVQFVLSMIVLIAVVPTIGPEALSADRHAAEMDLAWKTAPLLLVQAMVVIYCVLAISMKRLRDAGLPVFLAAAPAALEAATYFFSLPTFDGSHYYALAGFLNLCFSLAMLCWPSGAEDEFDQGKMREDIKREVRASAGAHVARSSDLPRAGFGRRGM